MDKIILKHVLKNAIDFNGSVNNKAVLGKILREDPSLKTDVPNVIKEISRIIEKIEDLNQEELKTKLLEISPELLNKNKEEKILGPLKPLKNAEKGKVTVRIAPSPSGPLHIGHAYGASLNYEYSKMYEGRFIVRIEDTNPEKIYPPAYELIEKDAQWLAENKVAEIIVQSSRLGIYYDHAEELVRKNKAYVCICDADQWREMKNRCESCPCRFLTSQENLLRFAKMFTEYSEGEVVLRLKTNINHKNPAMRDFAIMRINEHLHPKTGKEQRVWPLMVFSVAIDDHELGLTHVLHGKDHTDNATKEKIIMDYFKWNPPEYQHWGMINFIGFKLSSSETKLKIEQNEYHGWDDIRLPFLPALRRRGYQPEAFRKFATKIGLSLNDKKVSKEEFWKLINAFNKEIIEPKSNRYFFVEKPIGIKLENAPAKTVEMELHPDFPERGSRKIKTDSEFYISKNDLKKIGENKIHRLIDYCNFTIKKGKFSFFSENYEDYKNSKDKGLIIHWLPISKNLPKIDVVLEDGKTTSGYCEEAVKHLQKGTIIQFERFSFCKLDSKENNKLTFWYLHK